MFAGTRTWRERARYISRVRRILAETFNVSSQEIAEQNRIWQEWLDLGDDRGWRSLIGLIKSDTTGDIFKARAAAILLAPRHMWSPFAWKSKEFSATTANDSYVDAWGYGGYENAPNYKISDLSPQLQTFLLKVVDLGSSSFPQIYNRAIVQLLEVLGAEEERADDLFERYRFDDPWMYSQEGGVRFPIFELLEGNVPEKFRQLGIEKTHTVIRNVRFGSQSDKYQLVVYNYASCIENKLDKQGRCPYGAELFASQLTFLLDECEAIGNGHGPFAVWTIDRVLTAIREEQYAKLRRRYVRHAFLKQTCDSVLDRFHVYEPEELTTARQIQRDYGADDPELGVQLEKIIAEGEAWLSKKMEERRSRSERIASVLAKMR